MTEDVDGIVSALIKLGMRTNEAKVLSLLRDGNEYQQREMEQILFLRQPEVSVACKVLRSRGWIKGKANETERGRPSIRYSLSQPWELVISDLQADVSSMAEGLFKECNRALGIPA